MKGNDLRYQKDLHKTRLVMLAIYEVNRSSKHRKEPFRPDEILHLPLLDEVKLKKQDAYALSEAKKIIEKRWQSDKAK